MPLSLSGKVVILIIILLILVLIAELLRRKKITEALTLWWLVIISVFSFLALNRFVLFYLTRLIGGTSPYLTLMIFSLLFIMAILIYFSVKVSVLSSQMKYLAQYVSLLKLEISENNKDRNIINQPEKNEPK